MVIKYKIPSSTLLAPIKDGGNPQIANLDKKRFALAQEPDKKKAICSSTMKELTGDDNINTRKLYSGECEVKLTLSYSRCDMLKVSLRSCFFCSSARAGNCHCCCASRAQLLDAGSAAPSAVQIDIASHLTTCWHSALWHTQQHKPDESLQIVPNNKTERQCLYVCGQSGSGKSYFTTKYVKEYKKMFPKRNVYVISSIAEDKSIESLKPKRINVLHPEFMFDEFTAEDFIDSLVIADDVDVFPTKIKKKVLTIINSILQIGRHFNVSLCFTTHNPTNGAETKVLLAEAHIITVFPKATGNRALKYILDSYLGMDKSQIAKLKKLKSRAVSVIRGYPQVVLGEQEAFLMHEF